MFFGPPLPGPLVGVEQPSGIGGGMEQVGRLLLRGVFIGGHENGVPLAGNDLDGSTIVVDLLDEREQRPADLNIYHLKI